MSNLSIVRGDTETIKLRFKKDGNDFKPKDIVSGDIFTFTVRNQFKNEIVIQKEIEYPSSTFYLSHEDTKNLKYGNYDYDIEYRKKDYSVVKTLLLGRVKVTKEVTY